MCAFAGNYLRPAKFNASLAHAIAREDSHLAALLNGYTRFVLKLSHVHAQLSPDYMEEKQQLEKICSCLHNQIFDYLDD
jgi:hypothetical protein